MRIFTRMKTEEFENGLEHLWYFLKTLLKIPDVCPACGWYTELKITTSCRVECCRCHWDKKIVLVLEDENE